MHCSWLRTIVRRMVNQDKALAEASSQDVDDACASALGASLPAAQDLTSTFGVVPVVRFDEEDGTLESRLSEDEIAVRRYANVEGAFCVSRAWLELSDASEGSITVERIRSAAESLASRGIFRAVGGVRDSYELA